MCKCFLQGSAGGSGPLASGYEEEAAGNAASGEHANKQSVPAPSHSRVTAREPKKNVVFVFFFFFTVVAAEDSFVEGEEGEEYEEEDEEDYSAASTTSGPKKAQTKTSFWGWMDQV
jgi:hypothetical protein